MSHLYPSLEDMAVGKLLEAQLAQQQQPQRNYSTPSLHSSSSTPTFISANPDIPPPGAYPMYPGAAPPAPVKVGSSPKTTSAGYPSLDEYMGLTPEVLQAYLPFPNVSPTGTVQQNGAIVAAYPTATMTNLMVAPVTGNAVGLRRAEVTHGIRQVNLCKDAKGKVGLRLLSVNNGVFVSFVMTKSPAALAGLRFGDQLLQIDGENCAGWSTDQATKKLTKAGHSITLAVRDRPFERTITMHKDSGNRVGFGFKDGKIGKIVKDSSAARNGILTEHNILEVNGQNVVGMKDNEVMKLLDESANNVTITIMPTPIFQHIVKNMSSDLIRKSMDHSVPFI